MTRSALTRERDGEMPLPPGRSQAGVSQPGTWGRRDVVKLGAMGLGVGTAHMGRRAGAEARYGRWVHVRPGPDPAIVIDGIAVKALALRALDAAKAAGASYADVRLTRLLKQGVAPSGQGQPGGGFSVTETLGLGVRVRVGGAWGFAASPYWDPEEVTKLAREAVTEARANARGTLGAPEWAPIPVASGHWTTPITVDPFVLTAEEKIDFLRTCELLAGRYRGASASWGGGIGCTREEQAVATSEGSYFTQTLYTIGAGYTLTRRPLTKHDGTGGHADARIGGGAAGWEAITEADIPGQLPALYEAADPRHVSVVPPVKPGEVGRYDVVLSGGVMANLLRETLGVATQLDRALGWEANAGGTSYLGPDPLALLGSDQVASPLVTVTANRSMPRGVATVKWDAEGVVPEDFTLIKEGVLVDYQTTRGQAPLLAPYYQQAGKPVRSHGCAGAESALFVTTQHVPNLVLEPGPEDVSFEDLVQDTKRGLAVLSGKITTDFQARTGIGNELVVREIVNGQLGAAVTGLAFLFTSPGLWKNVVALGGVRSVGVGSASHTKGQPAQARAFTVRTVPAKVTGVDFIDPLRKA